MNALVLWTLHIENGTPSKIYVASYREHEKSISGLLVSGARVFDVPEDVRDSALALAVWVAKLAPPRADHTDHVTHACDEKLTNAAMASPMSVRLTREVVLADGATTVGSQLVLLEMAPELVNPVAALDEAAVSLATQLS